MPKQIIPSRKTALQRMQEANSYSKTNAEFLTWSYYDQISLLSTTLTHTFFVTGTGTGKNLSQTNMPTSGQLPQGQSFVIHEIGLLYSTDTVSGTTDLLEWYKVLANTTVEFKVTGKDSLFTITLQELCGASTLFAITPTAAGDNISQIQPWYRGVWKLKKYPITIGATQTFNIEMVHHVAPSADLDGNLVKLFLRGDLRRLS